MTHCATIMLTVLYRGHLQPMTLRNSVAHDIGARHLTACDTVCAWVARMFFFVGGGGKEGGSGTLS